MLTFQQKIHILESFPQLERRDVSLGRVNFHYEGSIYDKKRSAIICIQTATALFMPGGSIGPM